MLLLFQSVDNLLDAALQRDQALFKSAGPASFRRGKQHGAGVVRYTAGAFAGSLGFYLEVFVFGQAEGQEFVAGL